MQTYELDPKDYKYVIANPDLTFNPARNKAVIEETMKEADTFHKTAGLAMEDALGERIEAVSAYACYRFNRGTKTIKQYLGDKVYNAFIGEKIMSKIRVADTVNRLNGNTKLKKPILL
jgi:hypothetical protein